MKHSRLLLVLVALPLALGACKKKAPRAVAAVPVNNPGPTNPTPPRPTETPTNNNSGANSNTATAEAIERARRTLTEMIFFEYNLDELRDDARATLDQKITLLNANPAVRIRIAGHCDERGNDEYNLVLGRRRAEAAKRYLTDRGIDASRIETASFGRERPLETGSTEEAYSRNRRDEFEITAGGDQIRPVS